MKKKFIKIGAKKNYVKGASPPTPYPRRLRPKAPICFGLNPHSQLVSVSE